MNLHKELETLYNNDKLNKLKWFSFINEKRSESMLVNEIKKKFGNDVILILGNWSMNKQGIKYENLLSKNFLTLKLNEFRTSSLFEFHNAYAL